ncbi:MAG: C-type lectin domain-containing protein [Myxococcales bacterium]
MVLSSAWFLTACPGDGPADLRWTIDFKCPSDAMRTMTLRVRVLRDACGGTDAAYDATLVRGEAGPDEIVSPGDYFLEVTAFEDSAMQVPVATACRAQALPAKSLSFTLTTDACDLQMPEMDGSLPRIDDGGVTPVDDSGVVVIPDPPADAGKCPPEGCPSGCKVDEGDCACSEYNGHTYLVCPSAASWDNARKGCRSHSTDLVVINSADENAYVASKLGGVTRWIGANDKGDNGKVYALDCKTTCVKQGDEGKWTWIDGPANNARGPALCDLNTDSKQCVAGAGQYVNWAAGQPDNTFSNELCYPSGPCPEGEDCATIGIDGTWNDSACSAALTYVCETF